MHVVMFGGETSEQNATATSKLDDDSNFVPNVKERLSRTKDPVLVG